MSHGIPQLLGRPAAPTSHGSEVGALGSSPALLEIEALCKHFGGIQALQDVSLAVAAGTVHGLCGANGAGKSTLVRILAGAQRPDRGLVRFAGEVIAIHSPRDANALGMRFIHQELNLVPTFTAIENMSLGDPGCARYGILDRRHARKRAREVMERLEARFRLDVSVDQMTVSERWMVSLGRALMQDARLVAMDEPTASFTDEEAERLFSVITDLRAHGVAVLYISHRLDEVLRIADRVTVLRNGRVVATHPARAIDRARLTREIVGRDVEPIPQHSTVPEDNVEIVLSARDLARPPRVRGVDLDVRRGEIVGIAGLVGAGRTEVLRMIFGADRPTGGTMTLDGAPFRPRSPYEAIRRGVALVPEERRSEGLLLQESIAFNLGLATLGSDRFERTPFLRPSRAHAAARELIDRLGIAASSTAQPVAELSGGNQQKVLVGRFVRAAPKLLMLDEPATGVDVGARTEIYRLIASLARAGTAVLLVSSDFEELAICDRIAVMREGQVTRVLDGDSASKDHLTALCYTNDREET